jgi:cell division protein FtsN
VPQRTAEQDAAEAEKNKNWDPNSPLYGKNPARPNPAAVAASGAGAALPPVVPPPIVVQAPPGPAVAGASAPAAKASPVVASTRDPAAILAGQPGASVTTASAKPGLDPFTYFVQAGAYARTEDAEQQRGKLALIGLAAKITEREQAGRTMYRVRVGPFERKEEADAAKEKLDGNGIESALVRVQR